MGSVSLLSCFHYVFGLKLNIHKPSVFGVEIDYCPVQSVAVVTGCKSEKLHFVYLGIPWGLVC